MEAPIRVLDRSGPAGAQIRIATWIRLQDEIMIVQVVDAYELYGEVHPPVPVLVAVNPGEAVSLVDLVPDLEIGFRAFFALRGPQREALSERLRAADLNEVCDPGAAVGEVRAG